jgi:mono/diheme cytochrome c family protein
MRPKMNLLILLFMTLAMGIVFGCSSGSVTSSETETDPAGANMVTDVSEGRALYASKCVGCHGNIDTTDIVTPTSFSDIKKAISGNRGGMGMYASMNDADVQALTDAINSPGTPAPAPTPITPVQTAVTSPATLDGTAIYASRCASCHGVIALSNKIGTTIDRVQTAIAGNVGRMGSLSTMTALEVQAVVASLNPSGPTPAPLAVTTPSPSQSQDGASLYSANCAGCHGALGSSAKVGMTLARLQTATSNNIGGMGYLSQLTVTQQQAIVTALTPTTPASTPSPTSSQDGASLYSANCAGCHGALGSSAKVGMTLARLQTATNNNIGGMGYLSQLTVTQQQAIVTVLTSTTPLPNPTPSPTPVTDGATLYSANCAGCHGALASSGKAGATTSRIQSAISGNIGNMGYLTTLSTAKVTAIAAVLTTAAPPSPTDGPGLYAANCASCHGSLAKSEVRGESASDISKAISKNKGGMKSLSNLTSGMITAIANALKK